MRVLILFSLVSAAFAADLLASSPEVKGALLETPVLHQGKVTAEVGKDLTQDVAIAQDAVAKLMREVQLEETQFVQLKYLAIVDSANRGNDIYRMLRELKVPQDVIGDISRKAALKFDGFKNASSRISESYERMEQILLTINKELHSLNATLRQTYETLVQEETNNDLIHLDGIDVLKAVISSTKAGIISALHRYATGPTVNDVYLAIQDVEILIDNKVENMEHSRIIYSMLVTDVNNSLTKVITQIDIAE